MHETDSDKYQAHRQRAERLCERATQLREAFDLVGGMSDSVESTEALIEQVKAQRFKVLVLGEFKVGKSTMINALLRQEVLPAFSTPCTAVINEIGYAEQKSASVFFRRDLRPELVKPLPAEVQAHLKKHGLKSAPPLEVPVDQLEPYVAIPKAEANPKTGKSPTQGKNATRVIQTTPYDRVVLKWPLELCKNGVEIIDSPGLNEHGSRTLISLEYLRSVDAVLFVQSCLQLGTGSALSVFQSEVKTHGHEEVFIIANRWDNVTRQKDKDDLRREAEKFAALTTHRPPVYFMSAANALDGRLCSNSKMVEASGILEFEADLANFLVNDRGRVKLQRPTSELLSRIEEALSRRVPDKRKELNLELTKLRDRVEAERPEIERIRAERGRIIKRLKRDLRGLESKLAEPVRDHLRALANEIEGWVSSADLQASAGIIGGSSSAEIAQEVTDVVTHRLQMEQELWVRGEFSEFVHSQVAQIFKDATPQIMALIDRVDKMRARVAGQDKADDDASFEDVGRIEPVPAEVTELQLGGAGYAMGASLGAGEMVSSMVPSIALGATAFMLGVTNPLILVPALLGVSGFMGMFKSSAATDKVRHNTALNLKIAVKKLAPDLADKQAKQHIEQASGQLDQLDAKLEQQLRAAEQNFQEIIRIKETGEAKVDEKRAELDEAVRQLTQLREKLQEELQSLRA